MKNEDMIVNQLLNKKEKLEMRKIKINTAMGQLSRSVHDVEVCFYKLSTHISVGVLLTAMESQLNLVELELEPINKKLDMVQMVLSDGE